MTARQHIAADGRRHFQHGPIDLVIGADGEPAAVAASHAAAWSRFATLLQELVDELPWLKRPVAGACPLRGPVARRMWAACAAHAGVFITPMAAVAGAVADELIAAYRRPGVHRAWINNGGDIALHLAPGTTARVGLFADLSAFDAAGWAGRVDVDGVFALGADQPIRGVATSGWRGRSFSFGIADSVTVLARTAAEADAAATIVANAVDLDDPRVVRRPASSLKDDTDLGDRLVTVDVPRLDGAQVDMALRAGLARANALRAAGTIAACALVCQGRVATSGTLARMPAWHGPRLYEPTKEVA